MGEQFTGRRPQQKRLLPRIRFDAEPGQAIVLIALMLVLLLAFVALAIDAGGLFVLKRKAQNGADAASNAAAYAICVHGDPTEAGEAAARENGFETSGETEVHVFNPPSSGPHQGPPNYEYVEVIIKAPKPSYFAQVFFDGPLAVQARSVSFCRQIFDADNMHGLTALADCDACNPNSHPTIDVSSSDSVIKSSIASNCSCDFNGASQTVNGLLQCQGGSKRGGDPTDCGSYTSASGNLTCNPSNPQPAGPWDDPLKYYYLIEDYRPGGKYALQAGADKGCTNNNHSPLNVVGQNADGGCYHVYGASGLTGNMNGKVFEGLYYIQGKLKPTGTFMTGPKGATFVVEPSSCVSGNSVVNLGNVEKMKNYLPNGLAIFTPYNGNDSPSPPGPLPRCGSPCPAENISLIAKVNTWDGVVYAPRGGCGFEGTGINVNGAFVCQWIDFSGSNIRVTYNPAMFPDAPPVVQYGDYGH